jgi:tRNA pseudouridine38-40 synthase
MNRTYLALLHYDGAQFVGWQRQARGRSVQGEFESILARLHGGERVVANAAGRTDAGVHASGMAVSFITPREWEPERLQRALSGLLPDDCWVESIRPVRAGFHARKSAIERRYRYDIGTDALSRSPFRRRYEWTLDQPLDTALLRQSATAILGTHDFRAFAARLPPKPHYDCTVRRAEWVDRSAGAGVSFYIEGDRFLHHMVRFLTGTMVDIALGRRPVTDMHTLLARTDNLATSPPAPPQGLFFTGAIYPPDWYLDVADLPA